MSACWVIPKVLNEKNEKVDSKLFIDLYNLTGKKRDLAVDIYGRIKNPLFTEKYGSQIKFDHNGEPTIASLNKIVKLAEVIDYETMKESVTTQYNLGENNKFDTQEEAFLAAMEFNNTSEYKQDFIAFSTNNVVNLYPQSNEAVEKASQLLHNYEVNKQLKEILRKGGLDIEILKDSDNAIYSGVYDPSISSESTNSLVQAIKIAKGEDILGYKLAEEVSHALIASSEKTNPLVSRLLKAVDNEGVLRKILGESYDDYVRQYEGDTQMLAHEAAGKLLADNFHKKTLEGDVPVKNLLQRVIDFFKNAFRKISSEDIQNAFLRADALAYDLSREILDDNFVWSHKPGDIQITKPLYNLKPSMNKLKNVLTDLYEVELKRVRIDRFMDNRSEKFEAIHTSFLWDLETSLLNKRYMVGIAGYLTEALDKLNSISETFSKLEKNAYRDSQESSFALRQAKQYLDSYNVVLDVINKYLSEQKTDKKLEGFSQTMIGQVEKLSAQVKRLSVDYQKLALSRFSKFFAQFLGPGALEQIAKIMKVKSITVEQLLQFGHRDIGFIDRHIDSLSYSKDPVLSTIGKIINLSKTKARQNTLEYSKRIKAMHMKLEQAGFKDTSWMYKRDSNGDLTGYIIQELDYYQYNIDKKAKLQELKEKYPDKDVNYFQRDDYLKELRDWEETALKKDDDYKKFSTAQKNYQAEYMAIRKELDELLPEYARKPMLAPQTRKDLMLRLKNSSSVQEGLDQVVRSIEDSWVRRVDDTEFGGKKSVKVRAIEDFEGREVMNLPIYYIIPLPDMSDLSTDSSSSLIAFAQMANNYSEMGKIIHQLELGRDVIFNREHQLFRGDRELMDEFTERGYTVSKERTVSGEASKVYQKFNALMESSVYQRMFKDQGVIPGTNVDIQKFSRNIAKYTVMVGLAFHGLNEIANLATSTVMTRTEAIGGEHFSYKNLLTADKKYWKDIRELIPQIGDRIQTSKLALWVEKFNVLQNFDRTMSKGQQLHKRNKASRLFNSSLLFFLRTMGEHWMNTRTSLALAERIMLVDEKGNQMSLYDAHKVVPIIENGEIVGATLEINPGLIKAEWQDISKKTVFTQQDLNFLKDNGVVTDLEVSDWNFQDQMLELVEKHKVFNIDDINAFSRKSNFINNFLNGDRGTDYKGTFQRTAEGALAMIYRSWMRNMYAKRWGGERYVAETGFTPEGYYLTLGRFVKELTNEQFHIAAVWDTLNESEKANMRRSIAELAQLLFTIMSIGLLSWKGGSDDDDENEPTWLLDMVEFQLRRNLTEVGVLTPTPLMISEFMRMVKSPTAAINLLEDLKAIPSILLPSSWKEEMKTGVYKGWPKGASTVARLVPGVSGVAKFVNPNGVIPYYKQKK